MDGEVSEFVNEVLLEEYQCTSCRGTFEIGCQAEIRGDPHPTSGLKDADGKKSYATVECPNCGIHEAHDDMPYILGEQGP